jgi:predicted permease
MSSLAADLRYAIRNLVKSPGFAVVAVLTLGLGIGATTTVFTSVNALLLRPYPYQDQSRIVALRSDKPSEGFEGSEVSYPNFADWRQASRSYSDIAAYSGGSLNVAGGDEPELVRAARQSAQTFQVLGVVPLLGRDFRLDEDRVGAPPVALLSYGLWQRRFAGDRGILGRTIQVNGVPTTVVGVMPGGFEFPGTSQLWIPLRLDPTEGRGNTWLEVVGRLKPGVSIAQAHTELKAVAQRLADRYPEVNGGWTASVVPLREHEIGRYRTVLYIMLGAVLFVLLIACANVANLLLARGAVRQREIAVRTALGAGRARIVRQLLTESVLLAGLGAMAGLAFAAWGNGLVSAAVPADRPFWMKFTIDARVLLFTIGVAITTGVVFGISPAWQASRTDLHESLKEGGRTGASRHQARLRSAFVIGEVALSLVLVLGATLMMRSFVALRTVPIGFDRSHVLTLSINLAGPAYDSAAQRSAFLTTALARLRAIPAVTAAAAANDLPLSGGNVSSNIKIEGLETPSNTEYRATWEVVSPDLFRALGLPVVRGRAIEAHDYDDSSRVAVVNETMVQRYWPDQDAIGRRFRFGGEGSPWITVVGVARNVQRKPNAPAQNQFYVPYPLAPFRFMSFVVRTVGDPAAAAPAAQRAIREVAPALGVYSVQTMDEWYRQSMWESRFYGQMFTVFAIVALLLASLGIYGVVAFLVAQRTREIGVRLALGAATADVLRLVVRSGLGLTVIGVVLGLVGAVAMTGVLRTLLYGVSPTDPLTFVAVPVLLLGVALAASYLPARQAARVDPMVALRYE